MRSPRCSPRSSTARTLCRPAGRSTWLRHVDASRLLARHGWQVTAVEMSTAHFDAREAPTVPPPSPPSPPSDALDALDNASGTTLVPLALFPRCRRQVLRDGRTRFEARLAPLARG